MNNSPLVALLIRIAISAAIVLSTYNPSGKSIYHWIRNHPNPSDAWVVLTGIVTALVIFSLLIASWKTFGKLGTSVIAILFAAIFYLFIQEGWVNAGQHHSIQWLALAMLSIFFGFGLAGAIIWRRITGQVVTDESDDLS
ncbi:MAG: DUF6524 family protein [Granulosicoccaceae bacterium]